MPSFFWFDFGKISVDNFNAIATLRAKSDDSGAKDFKYSCDQLNIYNNGAVQACCNKGNIGEPVFGEYSVISMEDDNSQFLTITAPSEKNYFTLEQKCDFPGEEEQTIEQVLDGTSNTFSIKATSCSGVPNIYPSNQDNTNPLSSCVISNDNTSIICTPTNEEMEIDKEYQIYYKQPCADELVFTGIKVIKKEATEKQAETQEENKDNSSTKASSSMIIIVCGLLLLSFWRKFNK